MRNKLVVSECEDADTLKEVYMDRHYIKLTNVFGLTIYIPYTAKKDMYEIYNNASEKKLTIYLNKDIYLAIRVHENNIDEFEFKSNDRISLSQHIAWVFV